MARAATECEKNMASEKEVTSSSKIKREKRALDGVLYNFNS